MKKLIATGSSLILLCNTFAAASAAPNNREPPPPIMVPPPAPEPVRGSQVPPLKVLPPAGERPGLEPLEAQRPDEPTRPPVVKSSQGAPYILGPGDELAIIDPSLGSEEAPYKTEAVIAPDGTLSIYPVGTIPVEGLTLGELTELLNQRELAFTDHPQVVVMLTKARPVNVHVLGEVVNPGLYSNLGLPSPEQALKQQGLQTGVGVTLSATERAPVTTELTVLTAIQMAGGVKDTADIRNIKLTRLGEREHKIEHTNVDLWQMLVEGDDGQDLKLRSGDTIFVPKGGPQFHADALGAAVRRPRPVRILGEVHRPGLYYLGPGDDLVTLLAKAGGFDSHAKQRTVLLSRLNHDGTVTSRVINVKAALTNRDKAGRLAVMPGDILVVDTSIIRRLMPTLVGMASIAGLFAILNVINASLPTTFLGNLNRGNSSNQAVGNAFFGFGLAASIFGQSRQSAPVGVP